MAGRNSDSQGLRRVFVVVGGAVQAVSALLLAVSPTVGAAFLGAVLLGIGWGSFVAVDQAVATGVLPDSGRRAQHLGIMNIAVAVPQNIGPLLGAIIVAATGGFEGLFAVSAAVSAIAGLLILRVPGLR